MKKIISVFLCLYGCGHDAGHGSIATKQCDEMRAVRSECLIEYQGLFMQVRVPAGWRIPGGHIEGGETSDVAAIREVREETGTIVEVDEFRGNRTTELGESTCVYACHIVAITGEAYEVTTREIKYKPYDEQY